MNFFATIRNWLVEDLGWKIFSLFLACVIWFTVHRILLESAQPASASGGSTLTYGNLPVLLVATDKDVHQFRIAPEAVEVTVSGSPEIIAVLQASQIHALVDLTGLDDKELKRSVEVSVPPGVTVLSVEPAKIGIILPPTP